VSALLAAGFAAASVMLVMPPDSSGRLRAITGHTPARANALAHMRRLVALRIPGATARRRRRAIEACAALAGELRSGQPMRSALMSALDGVAPHAVAAARWGGDVAEGLHRDAATEQIPVWRSVAACWEVSESSGAGLAVSLERLTAAARSAEEVRVQLQAHLSAPRATARMLALLPAIGILLGMSLGGDPLGWLLGTPVGRLCLAGGLVLTGLGLWWVHRIAVSVERSL
jgi:tight adherence protein B